VTRSSTRAAHESGIRPTQRVDRDDPSERYESGAARFYRRLLDEARDPAPSGDASAYEPLAFLHTPSAGGIEGYAPRPAKTSRFCEHCRSLLQDAAIDLARRSSRTAR